MCGKYIKIYSSAPSLFVLCVCVCVCDTKSTQVLRHFSSCVCVCVCVCVCILHQYSLSTTANATFMYWNGPIVKTATKNRSGHPVWGSGLDVPLVQTDT